MTKIFEPPRGQSITPNNMEVTELAFKYLKNNLPVICDAAELLKYEHNSVRILMQLAAVYVWPTTELIDWLRTNIPMTEQTIEIGSGNGVIAKALGIKATDSYMQSDKFQPKNQAASEIHKSATLMFEQNRIPPVNYGDNVEQYDAVDAIQRYSPENIFGCYITHRHKPNMLTGNALGVDEEWIMRRRKLKSYTVVGNLDIHYEKPILKLDHEQIKLEGLILRTSNPSANRIFHWKK
jgi:hypothetical protein